MEVDVGLNKSARDEGVEKMRDFLANSYALYLKTQNFHWNVKGSDFIALHLLFQKQYEELAQAVDEIAERVASLGSYVDGSFSAFKQRSSIPESNRKTPAKKMLIELTRGHETLSKSARTLIARFQELHDDATADLLIKRLGAHEKAAWMLRSHLA